MPDLSSSLDHRPAGGEYAPFFAGYVSLVPEQDILFVLKQQVDDLQRVAGKVVPEKEEFRYAPGKWSIREVFGHMGDAERVFGYRAFSIGRGSQAPLPGFDENDFAACAGFNRRTLASLISELIGLREANLALLRSFDAAAWSRIGTANNSTISVRALSYIMAGHVRHHLRVLRERYGIRET